MTDIIQIETQKTMENFRNNRHVRVSSLMYTVIQMSFCQEIYQGGFQLTVTNMNSQLISNRSKTKTKTKAKSKTNCADYFRHSLKTALSMIHIFL